MVNSSVSVASELVETLGLSMATRAPLCSVVRSKTIDGRTYQTCLFNSNKHLEHRTSQQYVIYSSSQAFNPAPIRPRMHNNIASVGACGAIHGWLSNRREANLGGSPR